MKNRILLLLICISPFSCGTGGRGMVVDADSLFWFEGDVKRSGEAYLLTDYATGGELSVAGLDFTTNRDAELVVENFGDSALYVAFLGSFDPGDTTRTGRYRGVTVRKLLEAGLPSRKNREETVAGLYSGRSEKSRVDLLLNGSYRFRQSVFVLDNEVMEDLYTGEWRMLSAGEILLTYRTKNGGDFLAERKILFDPVTGRITQEVKGRQIINDKTYI